MNSPGPTKRLIDRLVVVTDCWIETDTGGAVTKRLIDRLVVVTGCSKGASQQKLDPRSV